MPFINNLLRCCARNVALGPTTSDSEVRVVCFLDFAKCGGGNSGGGNSGGGNGGQLVYKSDFFVFMGCPTRAVNLSIVCVSFVISQTWYRRCRSYAHN